MVTPMLERSPSRLPGRRLRRAFLRRRRVPRRSRPPTHPFPAPRRGLRIALPILLLAACGGDQTGPGPDQPDRPAALVIHSGNDQVARAGAQADEPVRVRVTAQSGIGLEGVAVAFQVTLGGGSVPSGTAVTDANGIASPGRWTLGGAGPQELRASVPGLDPVLFRATALGLPAEIAFVAGAGQEARAGEAVAVNPEVRVTEANGDPARGVRVFFETGAGAAVERGEAVTDQGGRAGPGVWTLGTAAGSYSLTARVEEEGVRGNPGRIEAVALPGPAARIVVVEGDEQETETTLPVPVAPVFRIEDSYGNPAPAAEVRFVPSGDSQVIPATRTTDGEGLARVDRWVLGTTAGVTYRLAARLQAADGSTLTELAIAARALRADYDIEIVHAAGSLLTEAERAVFARARSFWEKAIRGDQEWSTLRKPNLDRCLERNGFEEEAPGDRLVDDLVIYATIRNIDGPGGVLGGAGPCLIRESNSLPVAGIMYFDRSDTGNPETFEGTVIHEMAHVIGFGTLWTHLGLLEDSASIGRSANTHFRGPEAVKAFAEVGGARYPDSKLVPVQNLGGPGVWNGHWRELVFFTELMTPFPDRGHNPVSIVTLASFVDIGYEGVDLDAADDYALPSGLAAAGRIVAGAGAERPGAERTGSGLPPGREIVHEPMAVIDREGRIVRRAIGARPPAPAHPPESFRRGPPPPPPAASRPPRPAP